MPAGTQANRYAWAKQWANNFPLKPIKKRSVNSAFLLAVQTLADDLKHIARQVRRRQNRFQRRFHLRL